MNQIAENLDMQALIHQIRDQIQLCQTADCEQRIAQAMQQYPHSPVPHNLMGILLSQQNVSDCREEDKPVNSLYLDA